MPGTGSTIGTVGGAALGTAIMPGVGTVVGGALGGLVGGLFDSNETPQAPRGEFRTLDPNAGIGQGSFGYTPEEIALQRQRAAALGVDYDQLQTQRAALDQEQQKFASEWQSRNPPPDTRGPMGSLAQASYVTRMMNDPGYKALVERSTQLNSQISQVTGNADLSDPGRFSAMSQSMQNRQGVTLNRFGVPTTAGPEIAGIQKQDAPRTYDPGELNRAQTFNAREFDVARHDIAKTQIDPNAGNRDYQNYQQVRDRNLEVMNAVHERATGRGGPSPAELQMKQGQDRAVAQQAALAASGGQMDAAMARRQAMLGAAQIGQRTASDTALLRANEQIAAQNTFGGLASSQQSSDLSARGQSFGQAQTRAQDAFNQNLSVGQFNQARDLQAAQFGRQQSFENAQLGMQQAQFNASQANQYNLARNQMLAQQGQFGAQFGLSQEQAIAQNLAQQRQFNAQFANQQNQFGAQFGAQQEMNQAGLTMQQRQINDQMTGMYMNQYMNSRGMQQQNAIQNQNAWNQMAGINAGVGTNNALLRQQAGQFQQQQQLGMLNLAATAGAGYMSANSAPTPTQNINYGGPNSGFNTNVGTVRNPLQP
jgi:hypothetical protein